MFLDAALAKLDAIVMSAAAVFGPGHPDQACDLVAASVVEEYLRRDPDACTSIRVHGGKGVLFLAGEVTSSADFDVSAVVKQVLAGSGALGTIEPFIAFEPFAKAWAGPNLSRDVVTVQGYATNETPELLPKSVVLARALGCLLEEKRTKDPDWFWLGADYDLSVIWAEREKPLILLRAEHLDTVSLEQVRARIQSICAPFIADGEVRVNASGAETEAGLMHRMGASGRLVTGHHVHTPIVPVTTGLHLRHPRQLGAFLCRALARRLIQTGQGTAVAVRATWLPLEMRASYARVWNQAGQDLTARLAEDDLDLSRVPAAWIAPHLTTALVKTGTDASVLLPWEQ